ncbi:MAG: alpha/beta fold hydrolase [Cyanobacteria bacterium J06558_2]
MRQALLKGNLAADEVTYIESHGTGTSLGDPIEVNSLKEVFSSGRSQTCYLGSLKTNIGHLEAAAGIAGLIKTVLCLQHRAIPPNLHFQQLNPLIDLADSQLEIAQKLQPWDSSKRYAGVSSFGFGGTNAHVIIGELNTEVAKDLESPKIPIHLLTLGAKTPSALKELSLSYQAYLEAHPEVDLADICYTTNVGRTYFDHRLAIAAADKTQLKDRLTKFISAQSSKGLVTGKIPAKPPQIAFLFTGQGSQYVDMGYELYQTQPKFRDAIESCSAILSNYLDHSLEEILYSAYQPTDSQGKGNSLLSDSILNKTIYTQPAIFALEYALAQMWLDWGVQPSVLTGHSVGEYVAATLAGIFSLPDALKLVATRGKLMQNLPQGGAMYAVFTDEATVAELIAPFGEQIAIAAVNTRQSIVISGNTATVQEVASKFESQGIKSKQLKVDHAFHSPLMQPILEEFGRVAQEISYNLPQIKLISNVTGKVAMDEVASSDYWIKHVVAPVRFADGMTSLHQEQCQIFLEIGSQPILLGMGRGVISVDANEDIAWLPSLRPRKKDWEQILASLSSLFVRGVAIDWHQVVQGRTGQKIALPTYPFQRQSYWLTPGDNANKSSNIPKIEALTSKSSPGFYQLKWQVSPPQSTSSSDSAAEQNWLIICDRQSRQLAQELASGGSLVIDYSQLEKEQLRQILAQSPQTEKIIYLAGLDQPELSSLTDIESYQEQHCTNLLNLIQALTAASHNIPIWLVNRGSQGVNHQADLRAVSASCLWGISQAIALEHPELWGGIVDLSPQPESDEAVQLFQAINDNPQEDRLAVRGRELYVARLYKSEPKPSKAFTLDHNGAYLITGGLGALGLQLAQWLVSQGAKHLILLGRSKPKSSAKLTIEELQHQGFTLDISQADITDYQALKKIISSYDLTSPTPLKGIVHAAGVLDDGLLAGQTWSRFKGVIDPKVKGAWNLHQATQGMQLDFFVLFSSVASLIGSPGQSSYSVANAGLDAIARYRQGLNLPAVAINWGAWGGGGMAVNQGFKVKGLDLIEPSAALSALEQVLASELPQIGVISADWSRLSQQFPYLQQSNYFSELVTVAETEQTAVIFEELLTTPEAERPRYLTQYLTQAIAAILQIPAANLAQDVSLLDLGMDSLMVMEAINQLKADLKLILYPREFYERPQINDLAAYLAKEFTQAHQTATPEPAKTAESVSSSQKSSKKLPPAAFILSSPRSGSTLLRVMLAGHPQLSSPPELHLLPFDTMAERAAELGVSQLGEGLKRALMSLKNIDAAKSQKLIEELTTEDCTIAEVYQQLQQLSGDRLLVDKSPTYASQRSTLAKAEAMFDGAKYIHLVRHPYSVIESFARMRMDKLIGQGNGDPYELAELIWRESNQNILDFAQDLPPERYHLVYYEDLVSRPQEILQDICQFLAIPFDPAVLTPYQGDRLTDGVSAQAMSLGDPNFLKRQKIEPQLATAWKEIKLPNNLSIYTQQLAQRFNYELTSETNLDMVDLLMEETLITIRGLKICLCSWGPEEGPLVICLHGILEQGAAWSEVAIRLAQKGYRVIAPDLRGHGRSDRVGKGGSYNLIDFLGDIDAIAEYLAGKAFILVGHSLGSVLGAIFATIRPQRIKNIVLVETILPTQNEDEDPTKAIANQLDNMVSPPEHPVFPDVATAAERLRKATPAISPALAKLLAERITEPCEGGVRWRWEPLLRTRTGISLNGIGRSRYLKLLQKITVPITLVYGDQSNFNRQEDLNKQQEAMPNATKVVVSGGHNLPLEAPSALAKIISGAVALTNKLIP